jgi:DNA-binding MarR family transcriptional regulator
VNQRSAGETLAIMNEAGLTLPQFVTLHLLRQSGPRSVSFIAERLHLSMPATSQLIDRLVRGRFATRHEHEADRRQRRIRITPSGRRLLDRVARSRAREFSMAFTGLPARLGQELVGVLGEVVTRLRDENP